MDRKLHRTWYRADATGYSALDLNSLGQTIRQRSALSAADLPSGIAAQCDAARFALPNCVEVRA